MKKLKWAFISIIIFIIIIFIFFFYKYKNNKEIITDYGEMVLLQFTTSIISHTKQEVFKNNYDEDIITVNRKEDGSIESIDYDMIFAMQLADKVMSEAETTIHQILDGEYIAKDDSKYQRNLEEISKKKGVVGKIPFATILGSPLLSFWDMGLPIRYDSYALVFSNVTSNIKSYGINHIKVELLLNVRLTQKMVLPLFSDIRVIEYSFPIALRIVYGEIPSYYYQLTGG